MEVMLTDGSTRRLYDSEFNMTSVSIPSCTNMINRYKALDPIDYSKYSAELYIRRVGNDEFDADPYQTVSLTSSHKIDVPKDTVGVKVIFKGIDNDWSGNVGVYYTFHTEAEDILLDQGRHINNATTTFYADGEVSFSRDVSSTLTICEIPNRFSVSNSIARGTDDKETFYFTGSITGHIELEDGNDLSKFSLYTIIPDRLELNELYDTPESLKDVLTFSSSGLSSGYIADHANIEIIENYKESGRTYIAIHFDFSDAPVVINGITVSGIPMYIYKDNVNITGLSFSHTMHAEMLIDQKGRWYSSSADNSSMEGGIWNDIDGDGNTSETASFSSSTVSVILPQFSNLQIIKSSKTEISGQYVVPGIEQGTGQYIQSEIPQTYRGKEYSYKLRIETGENIADDIIFADNLEAGSNAEWQGKFVRVDYSVAQKLYGVVPTVYYSEQSVPVDNGRPDITNTAVWKKDKPENVRAIAVDFGDLRLSSGKYMYVEVVMKAPERDDVSVEDFTITENNFSAYYNCYGAEGNFIEKQDLHSTDVPVEIIPHMGTIRITKQDSTSGEKLSGAKFDIYRKMGDTPDKNVDEVVQKDLTSNSSGIAVSKRLEYGNYYIEETAAPLGYEKSDKLIEVELNDTEPDKVAAVTVENDRKSGQFTITKTSDRNSSAKVQGARFAVYKSDGTEVYDGYDPELVTDANGELVIDGLPWGEYYAVEVDAPKGYVKTDKQYPFTVSADTDAGRMESVNVINEQIPASATLTKYEVLEDGKTEHDVPISGAGYTLYDSTDKLLGTYMTDEDGKIYVEDLTFGKYYFLETVAAEGYEKFEGKVEFTVDAEHTDVALGVVTRDTRMTGKMWLQKVDDTGAYVVGAEYGLFRTDDDVQVDKTGSPSSVVFTTNSEGIIEEEGLYWGNYYLKEVKAPKGYELNEKHYPVVVNRTTVNNRIIIDAVDPRAKGTVELKKVAKEDNSRTLEGAVFTLYKSDGSIYKDNLTTDASGIIRVKEIEWGSYYFVEKTAPTGYGLNPDKIRFSVNYLTAGKVQTLTVEDPEISCELTVTKRIRSDQTVFAHGNPTFTFKIEGTDTNGDTHTYFRNVVFTEEYCKANTGVDGYVEQSIVISGLPQGTWTVTEVGTVRYTDTTWESISGNLTTSAPSDPTYELIGADNLNANVRFTNLKEVQSATSHNAAVTNIITKARKLTAIVAQYKGSGTVTTEHLDRTQLDVFAIYDDGSQVKLADDAYSLSPDSFDATMNGNYIVEAEYTEGGVTCSDSFEVEIYVTNMPFTWSLLSQEPFTDTDGTEYDGTACITGYTGTSKVLRIPTKVTGLKYLTYMGDNQSTGRFAEDAKFSGKTFKVVEICNGYAHSMYGVKDIETLIIPEGIEAIGEYAFWGCRTLTGELVIPDSVKTIGYSSFSGDTTTAPQFTSLKLGKNVETIGDAAFDYCSSLTGELVIPDSVTKINRRAFCYCTHLTGLKLGKNVETIGDRAFGYCSSLTGELEIPDNVTTIGSSAFSNCSRLTGLKLGEKVETIAEGAFEGCSQLTGELVIPDSVTTIGENAFSGGSDRNQYVVSSNRISSLKLGNNVSSIGASAFSYCTYLTGELVIPDSVVTIGDDAFLYCNNLENLTLGIKVETIGERAFWMCEKLTGTFVIPESVTAIGVRAFEGCQKLTSFDVDTSNGYYSSHDDMLFNKTQTELVCCPGGETGQVTIPDGVVSINDYAFYACQYVDGDLVIPDSVEYIGVSAFGCSTEDGGLRYVGPKFTSLELGENVATIGSDAFRGVRSLSGDLVIPDSVTEIGSGAFNDCYINDGGRLVLSESITKIDTLVFYACSFTGELVIPDGV